MVVAAAALFAAAAGGARAASYNIALDGYCDEIQFTVTDSLVVGDSYGFIASNGESCDDGYVVGTVVRMPPKIAPGGTVAILAGDFAQYSGGPQYAIYVNLRNHTWVEYASVPTTTAQVAVAGTWSPIKSGAQAMIAARPPLSSVIRRRVQQATR